jgi:hypothetical protein
MDVLKSRLKQHLTQLLLAAALIAYLGITLPSLFSDRHFMFNLEPYPDGLFFALTGRTLAQTGQYAVIYQDQSLFPKVLPLYTYTLALGYLVSTHPATFFVVNVALGCLSLLFLYATIRNFSRSAWAVVIGLSLYLSHGLVIWVTSAPMTENLALLLIIAALWGVTHPQPTGWKTVWTSFCVVGLLFTKYLYVFTAAMLGMGLLGRYIKTKQWSLAGLTVLCGLVGLLAFIYFHLTIGFNPFGIWEWLGPKPVAPPSPVSAISSPAIAFYGFNYFPTNIKYYLELFFGQVTNFLWLKSSLMSSLISLSFLTGIALSLRPKRTRLSASLIGGLVVAHLPILLIFYSTDARYVLSWVPLLVLGIVLGWEAIRTKIKTWQTVTFLSILLLSQLWWQKGLFVQLVSANLLHRTVGWQYQAIKELNLQLLSQPNSVVITALPPLLIEAYAHTFPTTLPVSIHQEFINKKQWLWIGGKTLSDLPAEYDQLLAEGKTVFITNAYVTHDHQVTKDFETLKTKYTFKEISTGCGQTCNLYQLIPKSK